MSQTYNRILLIGYGNPGRLDDGLGPALAEKIEQKNIEGVTVDIDYQLTVEDSMSVSENDVVIFADASVKGEDPFYFQEIKPQTQFTFTTHSINPETVLGLAHDMFGVQSKGYILGIRGYEFNEFGEKISEAATQNLNQALVFIEEKLRSKVF